MIDMILFTLWSFGVWALGVKMGWKARTQDWGFDEEF
jgi:hypothetical protein